MQKTIGADVGNYDTKSQETTTPSSFKKYKILNVLDEESIFYDGWYYSPTMERNNQQLDKTENDYCLIMTLFAIAKEIIFEIRREHDGISFEDLQKEIANIDEIHLGVGLPVGHLSSLAKKTTELYYSKMQNGISFVYRSNNRDYEFNFRLTKCVAFAQDYTAVAFNDSLTVPKQFKDYYIIGIGGGTTDYIKVHNARPVVENCSSLIRGTTILYNAIISVIQQETGKTMDYATVEAVLLGENTVIDEDRKKRIREVADEYANKLVEELIQKGVELSDYPSVFIGGGGIMLKLSLEKNDKIARAEFVMDVNANAKYFAEFVG